MDMDDHVQHMPVEEPFKIVGQLVVCTRDENGDIIAERSAGDVAIYRAQFGDVAEMVAAAWAQGRK